MDERESDNVVAADAVSAGADIASGADPFHREQVMEVVILADVQGDRWRCRRRHHRHLLDRKPAAVLGLATGSSPLAIYDELAARCERGRLVPAGPRVHPRRVRRPARGPSAAVPDRHRGGLRVPGGLRPGSRRGPGRAGLRYSGRLRGVRERDTRPQAALICRLSGSAPTATSRSTSQAPHWPRAPG